MKYMKHLINEVLAINAKKLFIIITIGAPATMILAFIEKYIFNDWQFLIGVAILILADTITGVLKAWKLKQIKMSSGIGSMMEKALVYFLVAISFHQFDKLLEVNISYKLACGAIIAREVFSIAENVAVIYPGIFPPKLLRYLKDFNSETGEPENGRK